MKKRKEHDDVAARLLNEQAGTAYTGLGRTSFRNWATSIGARRMFGRRVLYDRAVIDAAIDAQAEIVEV